LAVLALPAGARSVAFVDARRGMAIGRHLGQVWVTTDGGHTWSKLAVPLDGDPASVPLLRPVSCTLLACSSEDVVVWANAEALAETRYVQPKLVLPRQVPGDRSYAGLLPRRSDAWSDRGPPADDARCRK
jgi:hypothetical protein